MTNLHHFYKRWDICKHLKKKVGSLWINLTNRWIKISIKPKYNIVISIYLIWDAITRQIYTISLFQLLWSSWWSYEASSHVKKIVIYTKGQPFIPCTKQARIFDKFSNMLQISSFWGSWYKITFSIGTSTNHGWKERTYKANNDKKIIIKLSHKPHEVGWP